MSTILITGAGRGLGLEFARQYAQAGWRVIATCRLPGKAKSLAESGKGVEVHPLDVADFAAIDALAKSLKGTAVDLLLCNAGVYGPDDDRFGGIDYDAWLGVLKINALAPVKMAEAFVEHVAASRKKTIVGITSRMGSIGDNTSGGMVVYRSSKAALNAGFRSLAIDVAPRGITAVVVHPGWVKTDMGGPRAPMAVADSIGRLRSLFDGLQVKDSGKFFNYDGSIVEW